MQVVETENIIPIADFKTHASQYLRQLAARPVPIVITQNGRAAAVVLSPHEYDATKRRLRLLEDLAASTADIAEHRVLTTSELRQDLDRSRNSRGR